MKRTEKELLMRRVGRWLGIGFRFHRRQGLQVAAGGKSRCCITDKTRGKPTNPPRHWGFEFWRKVPGNPRNCFSAWDYEKFARAHGEEASRGGRHRENLYPLEQSELMYMDVPKKFARKDDVIDWLLFESDFLKRAGGVQVRSVEELSLRLETAFVPEKP